jgi:hypothetical protein
MVQSARPRAEHVQFLILAGRWCGIARPMLNVSIHDVHPYLE